MTLWYFGFPFIIETGIQLLSAIIGNIPAIIEAIAVVLPELISGIVGALLELLPVIIETGVQLLTALVTALPEIITAIVTVLPEIITGIIAALLEQLPLLIDAGNSTANFTGHRSAGNYTGYRERAASDHCSNLKDIARQHPGNHRNWN